MKILFLSPRQAFPVVSGAKLRESHFARALAREAEVTYLYFADPGAEKLTVQDLPFCRKVVGIPKPPAYGFRQLASGVVGRWPLPILNYSSAEMNAAVAAALNETSFDFIHLDSIHMTRFAAAAVQQTTGLRAIYNWHNIESENMLRFAEITTSRARAWYGRQTARKLESVERSILNSACGHVVCSERERQRLIQLVPNARVEVVENGVDTEYFASDRSQADSVRVVFVGSMEYPPNADAAVFFATRIWPRVRERFPGAEFAIVGAYPGAKVLALKEIPGVKVTGVVPDVRPYYEGAIAAVVPLRTGSGTRLKILEAMAAGVPVISTPVGAEGLDVRDGENLLLVSPDDVDGWLTNLARVKESGGLRDQLRTAGLELVRSRYDWKALGAKLAAFYRSCL